MRFAAGETIVRRGDPAEQLYFLTSGEVSVVTELPAGGLVRPSTLSPGASFGELAALTRTPRSADVRADTAVSCFALPVETLDRLSEGAPGLKLALLENLLANACQTVLRLTQEVSTLAQ